MSNNKVINSWDWDIRVRERNVRNGVLTDKDIEKHRAGLPDQAEHAESIALAQPALAGRLVAGEHHQPLGGAFLGATEDFVVRGTEALMRLDRHAEKADLGDGADQIIGHEGLPVRRRRRPGATDRAPGRNG